MDKKLVKIFIVFLDLIILASIFSNVILAAGVSDFSGKSDLLGDANKSVINILGTILEVVRIIGAAVALAMLMIIGVRYLLASAGDRADIKKYAMNYVIGAFVLFGASGLLGLAKNFVDAAIPGSGGAGG